MRYSLPAIPAGCQVVNAEAPAVRGLLQDGTHDRRLRSDLELERERGHLDNQPAPTGSAASVPSGPSYLEWNVTAQLASTYATNTGFLVRDRTENGGGFEQGYHSREKGTDNPPQLVVSFG